VGANSFLKMTSFPFLWLARVLGSHSLPCRLGGINCVVLSTILRGSSRLLAGIVTSWQLVIVAFAATLA